MQKKRYMILIKLINVSNAYCRKIMEDIDGNRKGCTTADADQYGG